jgi:hypothetical protein
MRGTRVSNFWLGRYSHWRPILSATALMTSTSKPSGSPVLSFMYSNGAKPSSATTVRVPSFTSV